MDMETQQKENVTEPHSYKEISDTEISMKIVYLEYASFSATT